MLLQHFLSIDYVKKKRREKKKKGGRDDAWEQDEFVSFKSIENDRSVCIYVCVSLLYHHTVPSYLTCSYVSVFFLFFEEVQSESR